MPEDDAMHNGSSGRAAASDGGDEVADSTATPARTHVEKSSALRTPKAGYTIF